MAKRNTVMSLFLGTAALLLLLGSGCGPSTELMGTPIPNSLPDTWVTARPPEVLETGFLVQFYWTAADPDGRIDHYQWRISNNGTDGISAQDTLTIDPATGDSLNPWFDITSADSTYLVTADIPDFPGDPEGFNRSYQTHTFWIRAIDDDGGIDPSPAFISFTSTTLLPTVVVDGPDAAINQREAIQLPSTVAYLYTGSDPDFATGNPTKVRYLWKRALLPDGGYARSRNTFENNIDFLVSFDDSAWSDWERYNPDDDTRRFQKTGQPMEEPDPNVPGELRKIYYAFAVQVQDTAGAVSIGRSYGIQVANNRITRSLAPTLFIFEQFLGIFMGAGTNQQSNIDIAAGQELRFSWGASADGYAGDIVTFRYGWDVSDVNDPADPNWALLPGNSEQHRIAPTRSFSAGVHTFIVEVTDNSSQVSRRTFTLNVVPVPDPADQLPLLYVDDVFDQNSNAWGNDDGFARDNDIYRDEFWLTTLEKVQGFNGASHMVDSEEELIEYRDVVDYRSLLWAGRWVSGEHSTISKWFRPLDDQNIGDTDQYVWLQPYQENVGNVLYVSASALSAFLASSPYELPIVFESREGSDLSGYASINNVTVRRGFGERELPDESFVEVGPLRYPYLTMGVATIDIMSPVRSLYEYGLGRLVKLRRRNACASMKGVQVDTLFKARYATGTVFPDTIWADEVIDQSDIWPGNYTDPDDEDYSDPLSVAYVWSNDEFYDTDVINRGTLFNIQQCGSSDAPVNCVEPMFRSISRYDWVQMNQILVEGNLDWPEGFYGGQGQMQLDAVCGTNALSLDRSRAITDNQVVAFIARKTAPNKPSQAGDVVFGFDAYRMDHQTSEDFLHDKPITKAIHWVLGTHFGLRLNP